jgi:hypothetical protein
MRMWNLPHKHISQLYDFHFIRISHIHSASLTILHDWKPFMNELMSVPDKSKGVSWSQPEFYEELLETQGKGETAAMLPL